MEKVSENDPAVKLAALRALLQMVVDEKSRKPLPLKGLRAEQFRRMVLHGDGERAIASALTLSPDEVRTMLIRLAC